MKPFVPNVEVVIQHNGGQTDRIPLVGTLTADYRLCDGPLYTKEEWESFAQADWEYSAAEGLTYKGQPGSPYRYSEVKLRMLINGDKFPV